MTQKIYLARKNISPKTMDLITSINKITLDKSKSRSPMGGIALKHYKRFVKFNYSDAQTQKTVEDLIRAHKKMGSIFMDSNRNIKPEFRKKIYIPAIKIRERVSREEELKEFKAKREKRNRIRHGLVSKKEYTGKTFKPMPFSEVQKLFN